MIQLPTQPYGWHNIGNTLDSLADLLQNNVNQIPDFLPDLKQSVFCTAQNIRKEAMECFKQERLVQNELDEELNKQQKMLSIVQETQK